MARGILFFILIMAVLIFLPARSGSQSGGTIQGKVSFTGTAAKASLISMAADPNCLRINAGKKNFDETLVVNGNATLRNSFVHIKSGIAKKFPPPAKPVTIEQKGCIYYPRVQGAIVGQQLKIVNSDATLHNIHADSKKYLLNIAQPISGMVYDLPLKSEEVMLWFKCEIHTWMNAYVGVLTHPYYAVTGTSGTYEIKDVPPGKYMVSAWHEQLGESTREVQVSGAGSTTVDFEFGPR